MNGFGFENTKVNFFRFGKSEKVPTKKCIQPKSIDTDLEETYRKLAVKMRKKGRRKKGKEKKN